MQLICGDNVEAMRSMSAADRIYDAIVTDPPYGIGDWDWRIAQGHWASEAIKRVRPGGYMLSFADPKTMYHMFYAWIHFAEWEIVDTLIWLYGNGLPRKGLKPAWQPIGLFRRPGPSQALSLDGQNASGRHPAGVLLDEDAAMQLDEQTTHLKPGGRLRGTEPAQPAKHVYGDMQRQRSWEPYGDSGGASRFFYCAKAAPGERHAGAPTNDHPTVKPIALMRWLIRLITRPGDSVLDPFCGSGSTGCAAALENREFVGIDSDPHAIEIAQGRIEHWSRFAHDSISST